MRRPCLAKPYGQGKTRVLLKFKVVSAGSEGKFKATCSFPDIKSLSENKVISTSSDSPTTHSMSHVPGTTFDTIPWSSHLGDRGYFPAGSWGQGRMEKIQTLPLNSNISLWLLKPSSLWTITDLLWFCGHSLTSGILYKACLYVFTLNINMIYIN